MNSPSEACQARPEAEVLAEVMNPCRAKSEQEHVAAREIEKLRNQLEIVTLGLRESVKLQSHYAGLLNIYDGGQRTVFQSSGQWLLRLAELKSAASLYEAAHDVVSPP